MTKQRTSPRKERRRLADLVAPPPGAYNYRTGLHITLATQLTTSKRLRGFISRFTRLEPGLFTLVSPSRLYGFDGLGYHRRGRNPFCRPLREAVDDVWLASPYYFRCFGRHRSVNLTKAANRIQLLEVRMHNGTVDYRKIIPWICLWMKIFNHSRYRWRGEPRLGRIFRGGNRRVSVTKAAHEDIFNLLRDEGIVLGAELEAILRRRRDNLKPHWQEAVPQRVEAWEKAGWYDSSYGENRPPVAA